MVPSSLHSSPFKPAIHLYSNTTFPKYPLIHHHRQSTLAVPTCSPQARSNISKVHSASPQACREMGQLSYRFIRMLCNSGTVYSLFIETLTRIAESENLSVLSANRHIKKLELLESVLMYQLMSIFWKILTHFT